MFDEPQIVIEIVRIIGGPYDGALRYRVAKLRVVDGAVILVPQDALVTPTIEEWADPRPAREIARHRE